MAHRRKPATRKSRRRSRPSSGGPWSDDALGRTFVPEFDLFRGDIPVKTAQNALCVRVGFLDALFNDSRVRALWDGWVDQLVRAPSRLNTNNVLPFVTKELGIRWPGCVSEILDVFHRMVLTKSATVTLDYEVAVHAPPIAVWFTTLHGESITEARNRWAEVNAGVLAELAAAEEGASGGQTAKNEGEHLRIWGRWYYEVHVARSPKTVTALARENRVAAGHDVDFSPRATRETTDNKAHDCRKDIREGLAEAKKMLDLAEHVLSPPGKTGSR